MENDFTDCDFIWSHQIAIDQSVNKSQCFDSMNPQSVKVALHKSSSASKRLQTIAGKPIEWKKVWIVNILVHFWCCATDLWKTWERSCGATLTGENLTFQVKEVHVQHAQNRGSGGAASTVPQMVVDIFKDVRGDSWRHFSRWKALLWEVIDLKQRRSIVWRP